MPQAENVISFPVDRATTDLLRDFIGSPQDRLDEVTARLSGIEAILFLIRQAEEHVPPLVAQALLGIEAAVGDCVRIAELRPAA